MSEYIRSCDELVELIERWGFVPFFKNEIAGFSLEELTPPELWFADDAEGPWEWKGPAIEASGCAYGKFFRGKAVYISREWYTDFVNMRREGLDFYERYEDGGATYNEKLLYEKLEEAPSLLSRDLKRMGGFGKTGRKGFDTAITKLQMGGYVVTADFEYQRDRYGMPYGIGLARYATAENHFGADFYDTLYTHSPEESSGRIMEHLSALLPNADREALKKLIAR